MSDLPPAQRPDYLRAQYGDERNLAARAQIYDFGDSAQPWPAWAMAQADLQAGERVLECGCGPGWLWAANAASLPPNLSLTLTDQQPGMVAQAAAALGAAGVAARFGVVDITRLPFPADSFDVVVANHMLYHVADRPVALREVARVLRRKRPFSGRHQWGWSPEAAAGHDRPALSGPDARPYQRPFFAGKRRGAAVAPCSQTWNGWILTTRWRLPPRSRCCAIWLRWGMACPLRTAVPALQPGLKPKLNGAARLP